MKQLPHFILAVSLILIVACSKTETSMSADESTGPIAPSLPLGIEQVAEPTPPPLRGGAHDDIPDLTGAKVIVPDMVKGKWKGVVFMLEDKISHEITEHTVSLGDEWSVPNSQIKVKAGTFLPDLLIQGTIFTSVSNELKNPAVHVTISEKGQKLFTGWLFSLFPGMHAFEHAQFAITLKDVIPS